MSTLVLKDRVKETCTGTDGNFTFAGAVSGYVAFSTVGNNKLTYYAVEDADGTKWEVGLGTLNADSSQIARTTVLSNQAGNTTTQTFSGGTHTIYCVYPADKSVHIGANIDIGDFSFTAQTLVSDVATGTAPITVSSTTKVANLNADKLDDQEGSYYLDFSNFVVDAGEIAIAKLASSSIGVSDGSSTTEISLGQDIQFRGTANEVEVEEVSGTITIGLPSSITADLTGDVTGNADTATTATNVTVADESSDTTCFPLFVTAATGNLAPKSGSNLSFNSSSGILTATGFAGDLTGDVTGNADTVTNGVYTTSKISALAATSSSELAGVISDETGSGALVFATSPTLVTPALGTPTSGNLANCTFPTLNQDTAGTAAIATTVTVADESTDTTCFPLFVTAATGDLAPKSGTNLTFNSNTGILTATGFAGPLTGNVTGNASGSSGSCTGNAATATALASAVNIGGTSFDGTSSIVPGTITVADTTDTSSFVALFESATGNLAPKTDAGITYNAGTGTLTATAFAGPLTGNVTGNVSGTAATVTGAAQSSITSLGTLTTLTVDNITIDASTIDFNGTTGNNKLELTDNLASALDVTQSSNSYMKFVTTNSAESITTSKNIVQHPDMSNTALTGQSGSVVINANLGSYFTVATTGNITGLDIQNAVVGQKILIRFAWGGDHSLAFTDTVAFPGNTPPGTTASGVDVIGFICTTASSAFDGFIVGEDLRSS